MTTTTRRALFAPLGPGLRLLCSGRILTGFLYLVLLPLSALAEPSEEKQLRSDLYILF